jgi:hypothetical protein
MKTLIRNPIPKMTATLCEHWQLSLETMALQTRFADTPNFELCGAS